MTLTSLGSTETGLPMPGLSDAPMVDPAYADESAFVAEFEAEVARLEASGSWAPAEDELRWHDVVVPDEPAQMSRIEQHEWECWECVERDEAEAALLAERAPAWLGLAPGGELAGALEPVQCSVESPTALIEIMKSAARLTAWSESIRIAAIASFYRQRHAEATEQGRAVRHIDEQTGRPMDPMRGAAAEIAAALKLSPNTVMSHIDNALRLTRDLQDTFSALRCGAISNSKALAILDATGELSVDKQQVVEAKVLRRAPGQTQTQLRASLRRAVAKVDTRNKEKKHRDAFRDRACRKQPLADGMAGIWITHRADKIEELWAAVQSMAAMAKTPGDERTAEQRRADVVVDVFGQILANGTDWLGRPLPNQHRRKPHIEVTIPYTMLLGLDHPADPPAELAGYGPISAEMARAIAAEGTWRRLLTDPVTGAVLEAATKRHDPPVQVSETLLARHPVCNWTGCNRPARECDRDHGVKFKYTGTTMLGDARPYCEYHHPLKDDEGHSWYWQAQNLPDGSTKFTTPTGHVYRTQPPARGPILTEADTRADPPPF